MSEEKENRNERKEGQDLQNIFMGQTKEFRSKMPFALISSLLLASSSLEAFPFFILSSSFLCQERKEFPFLGILSLFSLLVSFHFRSKEFGISLGEISFLFLFLFLHSFSSFLHNLPLFSQKKVKFFKRDKGGN